MRTQETYRPNRRNQANVIRKIMRIRKRELKHEEYAKNGLNGPRAVTRRQRQIAAGQLNAA